MSKKRYEEVDLLKGIGIVLMIMGHIPFEKEIVRLIYVFHMPLFFIMSGFLYKKRFFSKTVIWKWAKRMIVPYFIFAVLGLSLWMLEIKPSSLFQAIQPIKSIIWINTDGMPINGAIWYLTATLIVYLLYCFIDSYVINPLIKTMLIAVLMVVGFLLGKMRIVLPMGGSTAMVGIGFFYSGLLFKKYYSLLLKKVNLNKFFGIGFISCGLVMSFIGYCNGYVSMRTGNYGNNPAIFYLAAFIVTCVLLYVASIFVNNLSDIFAVKWLKSVGRNSIVYLGMNELIINIVGSLAGKFIKLTYDYKLVTFIFSCLALSCIVEILKRVNCLKRLFFLS